MENNKKRNGFTVAELVIVVVVIAILAAVLIPTFTSLIDSANQSSDIQAAREMNVALAAGSIPDVPNTPAEMIRILSYAGFNSDTCLLPVSKGHKFLWYREGEHNLIVLAKMPEESQSPEPVLAVFALKANAATIQEESNVSVIFPTDDPQLANTIAEAIQKFLNNESGHGLFNLEHGKAYLDAIKRGEALVPVTSMQLSEESIKIPVGSSEKLTVEFNSGATNQTVIWYSSDKNIATVDKNGKVTAVSKGIAQIAAISAENPEIAVSCKVEVVAPVDGVSLNKTSTTLLIGSSETLTATVKPDNATNKAVTWKSSNTSVATVDGNGKVSAMAVGTAIITVTTADGNKTAACTVTVKPISVTGVTLSKTSASVELGQTLSLTATVAPNNATNKAVTWKSSNLSVATVDSSGKVTTKAAGTATITVTTADGSKTASCTVTVKPIAVSGVSLNKGTLSLDIGVTEKLTVTVTPNNAGDKTVVWSSSNNKVATVDQNGNITTLNNGITTITATANDGSGKKATCEVTVSDVRVVSNASDFVTALEKGGKIKLTSNILFTNDCTVNKNVEINLNGKTLEFIGTGALRFISTSKISGPGTIINSITTIDYDSDGDGWDDAKTPYGVVVETSGILTIDNQVTLTLNAYRGQCIYNSGHTIIRDCALNNNSVDGGNLVYNRTGTIDIYSSTLTSTLDYYSVIYTRDVLNLYDVTLTTPYNGVEVYYGSTTTVCGGTYTVSSNSNGQAFYVYDTLELNGSTQEYGKVTVNVNGSNAMGVCCNYGSATITDCIFNGDANVHTLLRNNYGTVSVSNTTFEGVSNNYTPTLYLIGGTNTLNNVTVKSTGSMCVWVSAGACTINGGEYSTTATTVGDYVIRGANGVTINLNNCTIRCTSAISNADVVGFGGTRTGTATVYKDGVAYTWNNNTMTQK